MDSKQGRFDGTTFQDVLFRCVTQTKAKNRHNQHRSQNQLQTRRSQTESKAHASLTLAFGLQLLTTETNPQDVGVPENMVPQCNPEIAGFFVAVWLRLGQN